jgi:anti-sigma factor RsiW
MSEHQSRPDLLARLLGPAGPEVSCEECFELLDEYVERELAGECRERAMSTMQAHLEGCPACREDHETLRALVAEHRPA